MRKPWMKGLRSFKFTADGCMLQDTFFEQRRANVRDATSRGVLDRYAEALGVDCMEANKRILAQRKTLGQ